MPAWLIYCTFVEAHSVLCWTGGIRNVMVPVLEVSVWLEDTAVETRLCPACVLTCAAEWEMNWLCPVCHTGITTHSLSHTHTRTHTHTQICSHLPHHFQMRSEVWCITLGTQKSNGVRQWVKYFLLLVACYRLGCLDFNRLHSLDILGYLNGFSLVTLRDYNSTCNS